MKSNLRTAVIGVGNMGINHARIYSQISRLVAVSDINEKVGRKVAKAYHAKFYLDYQTLLADNKIDAISVVVPTQFHKQITINCLENKVPVLVEKPISSTIEEAEEMIKISNENNTFLMVGHVERFNPAVVKLKKLIDQGKLGKIINLLAIRVGIAPPHISNSNVVLDLGIHDVDVFNFLLNDFPNSKKIIKKKLFKNNIADSASLLLEYSNATAIIQTNWITPIKMRKLYVTGTEGFAELDYISQKIIFYNKIINAKTDGNFYEFLSVSKNLTKEVFVSKKEPLKEELIYFLKNRKNYNDDTIIKFAKKALEILLI